MIAAGGGTHIRTCLCAFWDSYLVKFLLVWKITNDLFFFLVFFLLLFLFYYLDGFSWYLLDVFYSESFLF